jgi:hypothetical protein
MAIQARFSLVELKGRGFLGVFALHRDDPPLTGAKKLRKLCDIIRRRVRRRPLSGEPSMFFRSVHFRSTLLLAGAVALIGLGSAARAEESSMKQCADKWQAAKAANTTGGLSYLQFSSKCRADLKAAPAAASAPAAPAASAPAAPAAVAPAKPAMPTAAAPKPAMPAAPVAPAAAGSAVLPNAINPSYSNLKPGDARRKTCSEQYEANKANGGNAGLKWTQKGGGYYSICNAKLKG